MSEIVWATIGCGRIANDFVDALKALNKKAYAVTSKTYITAVDFAKKYNIEKVYKTVDDLLNDKKIEAVYICTPQIVHGELIKKAILQNKHVLCEKAMFINTKECDECIKLAKEHNVVIAEALTLFHMPLYKKLKEYIIENNLGKLNFIQINFGSYKELDMKSRFFNRELAGGALLDIGTYALSLCRYFMSSKAIEINGQVRLAESGVDEQVGILLQNKELEMATISLSLHSKQPKRAMLSYDKAYIEIYDFPRATKAKIYFTNGERGEPYLDEIECGDNRGWLLNEIKDFEQSITNNVDLTYLAFTKDVIEIITKLRSEFNITYPGEEKNEGF